MEVFFSNYAQQKCYFIIEHFCICKQNKHNTVLWDVRTYFELVLLYLINQMHFMHDTNIPN
jgi:hypothetical protein